MRLTFSSGCCKIRFSDTLSSCHDIGRYEALLLCQNNPHMMIFFILFYFGIPVYVFLNSSELKKLCETTTLNGALLDTGPYHGLQYIVLVLEGYITPDLLTMF